jgi:hypothetical protein
VDREERLQQMAQEYGRRPEGTLVIAPDNQSRRELNLLIHRDMQERGLVKEQEQTFKVLEPRQELTGADRAWAAQYEQGDVVRYSRGSKSLGIKAGEYATVTAVDQKENQLTVERANGNEITYSPHDLKGVSVYREAEREFAEGDRVQFTAPSKAFHVANRELGTIERIGQDGEISIHTDSGRHVSFNIEDHPHLDYGYAVTSHSSQGQTADRVLIHVDTEQSEHLVNSRMAYVAVSRARFDAQIYTDNQAELANELSRDVTHTTALEQAPEQGLEHSAVTIEHDPIESGHDASISLPQGPAESIGE